MTTTLIPLLKLTPHSNLQGVRRAMRASLVTQPASPAAMASSAQAPSRLVRQGRPAHPAAPTRTPPLSTPSPTTSAVRDTLSVGGWKQPPKASREPLAWEALGIYIQI